VRMFLKVSAVSKATTPTSAIHPPIAGVLLLLAIPSRHQEKSRDTSRDIPVLKDLTVPTSDTQPLVS
jgi:hypothetical protein